MSVALKVTSSKSLMIRSYFLHFKAIDGRKKSLEIELHTLESLNNYFFANIHCFLMDLYLVKVRHIFTLAVSDKISNFAFDKIRNIRGYHSHNFQKMYWETMKHLFLVIPMYFFCFLNA